MMLPAGVVQSIDANLIDLDNAWVFADTDIWSQDYSEALLQPVSIEAVDINDLRFKATEVTLEIRAGSDPASAVVWSGWSENVDDPGTSIIADNHNNLDGLQGTGPDYYHMDVTRWTNTGNGPWLPLTAGSENTLTGTLYGTAGAEFSTGALVLVTQGSGSTLAQTYTRGGDLSLAGNSGRANLRIMGSISADTAGVGPGLSFAGVSTGVGATGGGMLLQLATNNGLDIYSWNNTAWIKKSQINSAGMIAVVGGTAAGFLKANGTIDTTGYLTKDNPAFTGTLTGPAIVLGTPTALGNGVLTLQGNNDANGFADLNWYTGVGGTGIRRMTARWEETTDALSFFSSNDDGSSRSNRLRIYRNNSTPVRAYAGFDVGTGDLLVGNSIVISSTRKGTLQGLDVPTGDVSISKFGLLTELVGSTTAGALYPTGVTPSASNYAMVFSDSGAEIKLNASTNVRLSIANTNKLSIGVSTLDAPDLRATVWDSLTLNAGASTMSSVIFRDSTKYWTSFYASATEAGFRDYTDAGADDSYPIYWTLKTGGLLRLTRVTNMLLGFQIAGTTCVDSSRNASFVDLTTTGVTKITNTSGAYLYVDAGSGTASGVQMQYGGVTQAISRYIGPANTGAYQIVAYSGGSELDYPVNIQIAAGGTINLNRPVNIATFGLFRKYPGATNSSALFALGVTPSTTNYAIYMLDSGASVHINSTDNVCLKLNDVRKLQLTSAGVDLINSTVLKVGGTTTIDTSRNAWLESVTTNGTYGTCGLFSGNGDAASYATQNIKLSSWYGIGFPCTFDSTTRVVINTRNGNISTVGAITADNGLTVSANLTFSNSGTSTRGIVGTVGDNDYWRVVGGATATNAGFLELATADDGTEPIYVRQYTGEFAYLKRQITLLDASGNTQMPGELQCDKIITTNNGNGTNIRIGDDVWLGDINTTNTALVRGYSDATQGFLKFGNSGPRLGYNGSSFAVDSGMSFSGDITTSGAWIQATGSTTQGRFKSQYAGNAANYIGNWPASNWWGIGSDGTTTGVKGKARIGQCDGSGAWISNGIILSVLGDIEATQTLYGASASLTGSLIGAGATLNPVADGTGPVLTIDRGGASQALTRGIKLSCNSNVAGYANPRIELADGSSVMSIDNYNSTLRIYTSTSPGSATVVFTATTSLASLPIVTQLNERKCDVSSIGTSFTISAGTPQIIYLSSNNVITLNTDTATIGYAWDICVIGTGCQITTSNTPRAIYYNGTAYTQATIALTQYKMYRMVKTGQNTYWLMG